MNQSLAKVSPAKDPTITEAGCTKFFGWCRQMKNAGGAPLLYVTFGDKLRLGFFEVYDVETKLMTLACGGAYGSYDIATSDIREIKLVDRVKFLTVAVACENAHHRLSHSSKAFSAPVGVDGYVVHEQQ